VIRYLRKKPACGLLYTCTIITVNNVQIIMTHDDYIDYTPTMACRAILRYTYNIVDDSHGFWNDVCAVYIYMIYLRYNGLEDLWLCNYCSDWRADLWRWKSNNTINTSNKTLRNRLKNTSLHKQANIWIVVL